MKNIYGQGLAQARAAERHAPPVAQALDGSTHEPLASVDPVCRYDGAGAPDGRVRVLFGGIEEIGEQGGTVDAVVVHSDHPLIRVAREESGKDLGCGSPIRTADDLDDFEAL